MRLVTQFLSRSTWRLHLAPVFHSLLLLALHCLGSAAQVVEEGACQTSAAGVLAEVARTSEGTDICIQAPQNGCAQHQEKPTVACFPVPVDNVLRNMTSQKNAWWSIHGSSALRSRAVDEQSVVRNLR